MTVRPAPRWCGDDARRVPDLSAVRGDVRPRAHTRRPGGHTGARRSRRCLQPRVHLPEGSVLHKLDDDPDRVREPLVKRDGELVAASWDDAFAEVSTRLGVI